MKNSPPATKSASVLWMKILGAVLICGGAGWAAWMLYQKPVLPAGLEVQREFIKLTNASEIDWANAEVYLNHPLKGLRQVVPSVKREETVTLRWEDFKQVYEGGEFEKGPVFMIWVMVDGFEARKFTPKDLRE